MKLDISDLLRNLGRQRELINELLELAGEQSEALKLNELNKIIFITGRQEYIGKQLDVLEQKRRMFLKNYSQILGIEIKHFSQIQTYTSNSEFTEIQMLRDQIINACEKLKRKNELNSLLLKQGLTYTEKMLAVLNSKNTPIYGKSGDIQRFDNKGIVDTNV